MKPLPYLDIVLSVYNQEHLIERVLYGIFKNTTTPFTLIMVFDGCTDRTEERALNYIKKYKPKTMQKLVTAYAANVFETKANNIGFKLATSEYMITLQDDMVVHEHGWERRLTFPLRKFDTILAVTSRAAQDIGKITETNQEYVNKAAREFQSLDRNTFAIRDVFNRGPVAFRMKYLKELGFLNESYAPSDLDDADLSLRAWEQKKLKVGAYWIDYLSPLHWGKARAEDSTMMAGDHISRNGMRLLHDHRQYIESGVKHTEDINLPENEVDYITTKIYRAPAFFYKPIRIHKKGLKHARKVTLNWFKEVGFTILELLGKKNARELGIKKSLKI